MRSIEDILNELYPEKFNSELNDTDDTFGAMDKETGGIDVEMEIEVGDDKNDENFEGDIRNVENAELVYKREQPDGNYNELWIVNVGREYDNSYQVQRNILAGTDIDPGHLESEDGSQQLELYSVGNIQFLHITGMPH